MSETIVIKESPAEVIKIHEDVRKVYPTLENLTVRSRAEQQIFEHESSYGYDVITVEPINVKLQKKEVTPNYAVQEITADSEYDGLEKVTVKAKTGYETGDADVSAEDIAFGKIAYNKDGRVIGTMKSANNALVEQPENLELYSYSYNVITKKLENITLDVSKSKKLDYFFSMCENLKNAKIIGNQTYKTSSMGGMFYRCFALQNIVFTDINTEEATSFTETFFMCNSLCCLPPLSTKKR